MSPLVRIRLSAHAVTLAVSLWCGGARAIGAQAVDSPAAPTGAFLGRIIAAIDSSPARSVEVRLLFVDSSKTITTRRGGDSLDVFLDSLRTRVAVTDSAGAFAIRRLAAGHYLFRLRRIGFEPMDGVLTVGDDTVRVKVAMNVVSRLLARMEIKDTPIDRVEEQLARAGYKNRMGLGIAKTFIDRKEILHKQRQTLGELLSTYGVSNGDFILDRMPLQYEDIREYPAELVIGLEIYRHQRPIEFSMTRATSASAVASGGTNPPLVVIWTFVPGR
jgi:hypothetical protein